MSFYFLKYKIFKLFCVCIFFFLGLMASCEAIDKYEKLQSSVIEIESNVDKLSPEDWEKYEQEIEQIKERLKNERYKYTPEKIEKTNNMIGEFYALKTQHKARELKQDLKDFSQQLRGTYEAIFKEKK